MKKWIFLFLFFIVPHGFVHAYTDQITASPQEIWKAAQEVLKPRGFKKVDEKNLILETKWSVDRVTRSRGLLKSVNAKQSYERRHRLMVKIRKRDYDTELEIRGVFMERPVETNQLLISWSKYKPEGQDYDLERQAFMQILNRLEIARREALKIS